MDKLREQRGAKLMGNRKLQVRCLGPSVATVDPEEDPRNFSQPLPGQILWENLVKESSFLTEDEFWAHHDPEGRSYVTDASPPVSFHLENKNLKPET